MSREHMGRSARRQDCAPHCSPRLSQRSPSRRPPRLILLAAAIITAAGLVPGCGGAPAPQPGSTGVAEAFEAAHPSGAIPPGLKGVEASRADVAALLAAASGRATVLLPRWLPDGYLLAAPYIAVGDGSARPNPEAWGHSYRVSYTDGNGLLVLTFGAKRRPPGLVWRRLDETMRGRALLAAASGQATTVVTADNPLVLGRGEGLAMGSVVRVMRSIAPCD